MVYHKIFEPRRRREHGEFKSHKSFAANPLPLPRNNPLGALGEQGRAGVEVVERNYEI
jgi:hypothetical protein